MLLLPIGDVNEEGRSHSSIVNHLLVLTCFAVSLYQMYLAQQGGGQLDAFMNLWTFDPQKELGANFLALSPLARMGVLLGELCDLSKGTFVKMAAAAFLHGGLFHLLPNMLALWMLGDNVEYVMGHVRYFLFFILSVVIATCGQLVFATAGNFNGIIGASGGIFGVAAAYIVYFPRAKINFFYWIFLFWWGVKPISARLMIGLYFLSQVIESYTGLGGDYGNVAVMAHVTGFLAGFIMCFLFRQGRDEAHKDYYPVPASKPYTRTPWSQPAQKSGGWGTPDSPSTWSQKTASKFAKGSQSPWGKRPSS